MPGNTCKTYIKKKKLSARARQPRSIDCNDASGDNDNDPMTSAACGRDDAWTVGDLAYLLHNYNNNIPTTIRYDNDKNDRR